MEAERQGREEGGPWRLRVALWDVGGRHWVASYASFRVHSERENYRLELGAYSGNASDALRLDAMLFYSLEFSVSSSSSIP